MKFYKLINNIPVECSILDVQQVSIEKTFFGQVMVSTVFLPFDDSDSTNLFETWVFGGKFDGLMQRYSDYELAVNGHREICEKVDIVSCERKNKLDLLGI